MTLALGTISVGFALGEDRQRAGGEPKSEDWLTRLSLVAMMVYELAFAFGPGPLFYVIVNEKFTDPALRDRAMTLANFCLWSFTLTTVVAFPVMYGSLGESVTFGVCCGVSAACFLFALTSVGETRGTAV
jgi:hypothetical protein